MAVRIPRHLIEQDTEVLAASAGLRYCPDDRPGLRRRRCGSGFSFVDNTGSAVQGSARERALALAIPPAWTDVWISTDPLGHLQATGYDEAGRKQYRYHDDFRRQCENMKFDRLRHFGRALPGVRRWIDQARSAPLGSRALAMSALFSTLDLGLARVGNERSAGAGHHGATTLHPDHVTPVDTDSDVDGLTLEYTGKGGAKRTLLIDDDAAVEILLRLADQQTDRLFWYSDPDDREERALTPSEVNQHLAQLAGPGFTAKDFRTWGGSWTALDARARGASPLEAIDEASERLGNTRAVARSSYVHPRVIEVDDEEIQAIWRRSRASAHRRRAESALVKLLGVAPPMIKPGQR